MIKKHCSDIIIASKYVKDDLITYYIITRQLMNKIAINIIKFSLGIKVKNYLFVFFLFKKILYET